jgi:hypothetical protein
MPPRPLPSLLCALLLALLVGAAPALAKDSGDDHGGDRDRREASARATCGKGATARLRLRSRDGAIRADFNLTRRRSGETWRVVLVHERRVEWRGTLRTRSSVASLHVRRTLADLAGPDLVAVRASGPRGLTCAAAALLPA